MLRIWKYPVGVDEFDLEMPEGAQILATQMQIDTAQMWALVDPEKPLETRHFVTIGTGHPIRYANLSYIGTFQADWLVIHLFEIRDE